MRLSHRDAKVQICVLFVHVNLCPAHKHTLPLGRVHWISIAGGKHLRSPEPKPKPHLTSPHLTALLAGLTIS